MTERPRPYIPLAVRVQVIERQLEAEGWGIWVAIYQHGPLIERLNRALEFRFGDDPYNLDHDPALILRPYNPKIKDAAARYTPNANDPAYLVYRSAEKHRTKTFVRGERGQLSDTILRAKNKRMDENRGRRKRRPKAKIPSRPSPKRKF